MSYTNVLYFVILCWYNLFNDANNTSKMIFITELNGQKEVLKNFSW